MNKASSTVFAALIAALFELGCDSQGASRERESALVRFPANTATVTPDAGAGDLGAGYIETIEYDGGTGRESWWTDTDGVDPATAGCHIEWNRSPCFGTGTTGRIFGESCRTNDELVETNPGRDVCHDHHGDIGHPYVYSCNAWCWGMYVMYGDCVSGIAVMNANGNCTSARCECSECEVPCVGDGNGSSECDPATGARGGSGGMCVPSPNPEVDCCIDVLHTPEAVEDHHGTGR